MQAYHEQEKEQIDLLKQKETKRVSAKQTGTTSKGEKKKSSSRDTTRTLASDKQQPPLEVVFTNGYALSIIMRDESLLKIFLILCSLCNCVVGSQLSATQKAELVKALKEFNIQANLGYVLSIIGCSGD
jgi:hypothetical protein